MIRYGVSSGSLPHASGQELVAVTTRAGGSVVDLRAQKGHRWEQDGLAAFDGVDISYIGVTVVLGKSDEVEIADQYPGQAVKIFAAAGAMNASGTSEQFYALTRSRQPSQVLIETHRGYAPPTELTDLCETFGCRLVLDNLGLAQITERPIAALDVLAPHIVAVQLKGFELSGSRARHRPVQPEDIKPLADRLHRLERNDLDVTIESRAGTVENDIAVARLCWGGR